MITMQAERERSGRTDLLSTLPTCVVVHQSRVVEVQEGSGETHTHIVS